MSTNNTDLEHMVAILSVAYITTPETANLAKKTFESIPAKFHKLCVINKVTEARWLDMIDDHNNEIITNDKNILARAWNKGLDHLFASGYKYVLVINLDIELKPWTVDSLFRAFTGDLDAGIIAGNAMNDYAQFARQREQKSLTGLGLQVLDIDMQAFSCFMISRRCFSAIGNFVEDFAPAYFEDSDYIYRVKQSKFHKWVSLESTFFHHVQGTLKYGDMKNMAEYNDYIQTNAQKYITLHGGLPGRETK